MKTYTQSKQLFTATLAGLFLTGALASFNSSARTDDVETLSDKVSEAINKQVSLEIDLSILEIEITLKQTMTKTVEK